MSEAFCPCCGQEIATDLIAMDATRGIIAYGGREAKLTRHEFLIVAELVKAYPAAMSKDRLFDILYESNFAEGDFPEPKIIDVYVCKARKRLLETGIVITTSWGYGYGITLADPSAADALKKAGLMARKSGGHRWRDADDAVLTELVGHKMKLQQIAAIMQAPYLAVQRAMTRLGLDDSGNKHREAA